MGQLEEDFGEDKKRQPTNTQVQNKSLKQEILVLQDQLQAQFTPAKQLIEEIEVLEMEILHLEKYLLSVYKKIFYQQAPKLVTIDEGSTFNSILDKNFSVAPDHEIVCEKDNSDIQASHLSSVKARNQQDGCKCTWGPEKLLDSNTHQFQSSISQRLTGNSKRTKSLARAADSCHSLPLSTLEQAQNPTSHVISLPDHLGTCIKVNVQETPNWISEEMIRFISAIYCELADPPLINPGHRFSPNSFSSSSNELPPQGQGDMGSPQYENFSSFNSSLDIPSHIRESKEFSGPYSKMAEVQQICKDSQKLRDIEHKLQTFRSLVSQLEEVDPRKLKHEEKIAFWINVHNALVMHALFVYGIPRNNTKKASLILKAAYNVGGHSTNLNMIQSYILGCQLPRPGQWLRQLLSSRTKFKAEDAMAAYSIDHPEPRLYFALSTGSYSDPAVRVFTPKRLFEDLEAAKEEYIQSTFIVHEEKRLLLPRLVESFAKDLDLCPAGLVEMLDHLLPECLKKTIRHCQHRKFGKSIEWIPHNFTFRYLLSKELAR